MPRFTLTAFRSTPPFPPLVSGYIRPLFLLPRQVAQIVKGLANDKVKRGTNLSPAIRPGFDAVYYEIQLVLEVTLIPRGILSYLGTQ